MGRGLMIFMLVGFCQFLVRCKAYMWEHFWDGYMHANHHLFQRTKKVTNLDEWENKNLI